MKALLNNNPALQSRRVVNVSLMNYSFVFVIFFKFINVMTRSSAREGISALNGQVMYVFLAATIVRALSI